MKKLNCFEVSKQRTLGILDTEFNQSNKRTGHTGMNNAVKLNATANEQFAIKDCAAAEQIVSKRCVIDHSKFKRSILGLNSSDLEACYGRIIHTAAALALLRVGISHAKIHSMFSVIQCMIHRVILTMATLQLLMEVMIILHGQMKLKVYYKAMQQDPPYGLY